MRGLPGFNADGCLPPGDYQMTLEELRSSSLVVGPPGRGRNSGWNVGWRLQLVDNLAVLVRQLWQVGVSEVFIDGSFVEDKERPNDIDGYFVCSLSDLTSGRLVRELNSLDPFQVWTWDWNRRVRFRGYPKPQLPMWLRYRVELYPHYGQSSGLRDEHGHELLFPAAFRRSRRNGNPRGIVRVVRT